MMSVCMIVLVFDFVLRDGVSEVECSGNGCVAECFVLGVSSCEAKRNQPYVGVQGTVTRSLGRKDKAWLLIETVELALVTIACT